ncbi:GTPase activating protein and VPS9 domains 1 isoform X2 [Dermacentor variabilis]|uniref:GTPase activating protein and VPS9 domains 1 isoform X2 n=1 Tax=Dermacentor variabilis TaxID=34621 RepID=UPI003F5B5B78
MGLKRGSAGNSGLRAELLQLASRLRREHLFVDSEKRELQRLNERVQRSVERLQHLSWIWRQQRNALDALVLGRDGSPASCCQRLNALEAACFVDSYRILGIHDVAYATLLRSLRQDPCLVAVCLVRGPTSQLQAAVDILVSCVYGCGTLSEDQTLMLQLLRELMVLQLEGCDNVRRLLQHGSCAFSRVYKAFTEGLSGAQLFLTSALRTALIQVLVDDDLYLDIDPSKAVVRFPPEERLRHFGAKDSPDYARRLGAYRAWTIDRLARLAQGFVEGLRSSWPWLPAPLAWLVRRLHATLTRNGASEDPRAGVVCADLVFAFFICPAVVSPELHGLVDTHITPIARFNLMQAPQIIQVLALASWERPDPRLSDLYDRFPRDCISSLLDSLLLGDGVAGSQSSQAATSVPTTTSLQQEELARAAFLASEVQLATLVSFLRSITWPTSESSQQKALGSLLDQLPLPSEAPRQTATKASAPKKGTDGEDDSVTSDSLPEEVLVIPMPDFTLECPGMLSEEKVLSMEQQKRQTRVRMNVERAVADACDGTAVETIEKRTRFSLSQDQESIGTSDNLEAVSEGASNHSVASSLELENENDNYSDMVSANVSGHGTPNVSGRDTPSSQVEEEEPMERPPTNQNQADIEDKFGKFEISPAAPVQGDETKSIVSDTWSTDVLASDSEMLDQVNLVAQMQLLETHFQSTLEPGGDTGSDAWSTDVAASDNERLQDVDTDDTGSLARSDDTRSEISAGGDEEIAPPPVTDRQALRHSHHHHHHHRHHRRSNFRPPPQSPKQPLIPQQHGVSAAICSDGSIGMVQASTSPRAPVPPVDTILEPPRASAPQEQASPVLDGTCSPTQGNSSTSSRLAPGELSFFDPLAVQVELRHPEKLQATPSPSGGVAAGETTPRTTVSKGGGASPTPPSEGMQSLGRLSLAVKELPEEEALLLLQSEEEVVKVATEDERGAGDKRTKNFFKAKLSQFRFSFKPKQRKSNEVTQNGPDTPRSVVVPDLGPDAADILEKYRSAGPVGAIVGTIGAAGSNGASPSTPLEPLQPQPPPSSQGGSEEALLEDAQKKLRLVLALADLPQGGPQEPAALLQGLLAQATLLHNKTLASHVHEALRCLRLLDELQCLRVLRALEDEHRRRAPYIAYLVRCRQGLLALQAQLETRLRRTQRDRDVCQTHLATLCVRHFLDPREPRLQAFSRSFQGLTAADEKAQLVEQFLQYLFQQMEVDPTWQMASDIQINLAQHTIERAIMSQIYVHALYPNGDGDVLRDQVLHQHIQKLSRVVTVEHRDLRIPRAYHAESPWPSAQAQLGALAAHKSPQDKVACVAACCASLASLLSAAAGAPAAADDLVPVLVFVLIRANPPHLLSTVQFVETFQRATRCCQGEAAYWWTQFCAAIEFIKTMDY